MGGGASYIIIYKSRPRGVLMCPRNMRIVGGEVDAVEGGVVYSAI